MRGDSPPPASLAADATPSAAGDPPEDFELRIFARPTTRVVMLAIVVLGALGTRVWLSFGPLGGIDSDEAVTGLISRRMLQNGEFPAFYWGQNYGGTLDAVALAIPIWVFGTSTALVKVFYLLTGALISLLTWRVARHLMPGTLALASGALSLLWPLAQVWKTTRVNAFYSTTVLLGLAAWLLALQIDRQPSSPARWAGFGALLGIGWWVSPNIVYFAIPLSVWLVARGCWKRWRETAVAAASFTAGGFVWVVANIRSELASLDVPDWSGTSTYFSRLAFLLREGLPYAVGLRRPWDSNWMLGWPLTPIIYVALLGGIVLAFKYSESGKRSDFLVLGLAVFVFAYFPGNWNLFEGRYLFFITAVLPIIFARLWQTRALQVGLAAVVTATAVAFLSNATFLGRSVHESTRPMIDALQANGYTTAVADYWIAYQMTFEADEKVIASSLDTIRFEPYLRIVQDNRSAYVFRLDQPATAFAWVTDNLLALGIQYRIIEAGHLIAILPAEPWVP
jgi:4-amino-4-deoxy-L-arabinose transferase-like glycosyltransferase